MSKYLENKLTMFEAVDSVLKENSAKYATLAALAEAATSFDGLVVQIRSKSTEVITATAGKSQGKWDAEDLLLDTLVPVAAALSAYATKTGDTAMKDTCTISETKLRRMRDTDLVARATAIHQHGTAGEGLAAYGVTTEMLAALKQRIDAFNRSIGERESSVAQRMGARLSLSNLYDKADSMLTDEIDNMIEMLKGTETQFYNEYFAARVTKDVGLRHKPDESQQPAPTQPTK